MSDLSSTGALLARRGGGGGRGGSGGGCGARSALLATARISVCVSFLGVLIVILMMCRIAHSPSLLSSSRSLPRRRLLRPRHRAACRRPVSSAKATRSIRWRGLQLKRPRTSARCVTSLSPPRSCPLPPPHPTPPSVCLPTGVGSSSACGHLLWPGRRHAHRQIARSNSVYYRWVVSRGGGGGGALFAIRNTRTCANSR